MLRKNPTRLLLFDVFDYYDIKIKNKSNKDKPTHV